MNNIVKQQNYFNFKNKLKLGNQKEIYIKDFLNLCNINCEQNNLQNVKSIDLKLPDNFILLDVKYVNTPFFNSKSLVNIDPINCIPIKTRHINNYIQEEKDNFQSWVCFLIDFKEYNIYELKFFPVSLLKFLSKDNQKINNGVLNIDKNLGYNLKSFLDYCETRKNFILYPPKYNYR